VTPANFPPELDPVDDMEIDELQTLAVTFTATDIDDPPQELVFSLDATPPAGADIDPASGEFNWTPTEAQGPSTNLITVRVTDNGSPIRSGTQSFIVVVREVNEPPVLAVVEDRVATTGSTLEVQLSASDPDLPANILTYSFGMNAPADAALDPVTGRFTWTIPADEPISTNVVHVIVTDDGALPLADETTFTVRIYPAIQIEPLLISENQLSLSWNTSPGFTYRVEFKSDLSKPDWNILGPDITADGDTATAIDTTTSAVQKYYRVMLLP
jgi:hypothetical protein